ncbi:MAG: dienelactone hydrolase family protein [Pseudomonadota bacterium]
MCTLDGCGNKKDLPPIALSEMERRAFIAGAISLPLATVLAYPDLAHAQAGNLETLEIDTAGGGKATGVIAMPETTPAPAVVLIHEWWGLNDNIKTVAAELANQGFIAFAIDLYGGEVGTTPDEARALMGQVDAGAATEELVATVEFLRNHEASNGKVGTIGWCFGGGWSLNTSIATPVDATVIYYGNLNRSAEDLAALEGPVLGHFGTEDASIDAEMVGNFERNINQAGKNDLLTVHWYTANHAFANPTGGRYDEDDAALAWTRTHAFFVENLKS